MEVSVNDRLGVLGGMGPQATNTFYQLVIDRTDARTDQEHVNALILSDCQMPDRTAAILGTAEEQEAVFRRLLADARLLEGAGCTVLAACWSWLDAPCWPCPATPPTSSWTGCRSTSACPS